MGALPQGLADAVSIHALPHGDTEIMRHLEPIQDLRDIERTAADNHAFLDARNIFSGLRQALDIDDDVDDSRS